MTEHTPGPWTVSRTKRDILGPDGIEVVAYAYERDARLIAAAPELLEALESVEASGYVFPEVRAAIAKARGKQEAAQAESPGRSSEEG